MSEISDILNALKFGQVHQLDIELTPEQSADLLTHIDDLHFAVNEQPELTARIAELEAELAEAKAERRWIPVTERLPKDAGDVAALSNKPEYWSVFVACYHKNLKVWSEDCRTLVGGTVTHWYPLPEVEL